MNEKVFINTIYQLHSCLNIKETKHPLISVLNIIDLDIPIEYIGKEIITDFYIISMKEKCFGKFVYGRNLYDFESGVLAFIEPKQSFVIEEIFENIKLEGFMIFVHPDFFKNNSLSFKIGNFSFFSYGVNEALHLSEEEKSIIYKITDNINKEIEGNFDSYTLGIIIANLELLLNYSNRFYNRQFLFRKELHNGIISDFKKYLEQRINGDLEKEGIPTVKECAEKMCYSPNYLSDMLKKETGKNAKEFIFFYLLEKAQELLKDSDKSVSEIAYKLGFDYPEHFSKVFKKKMGISPIQYRNQNYSCM